MISDHSAELSDRVAASNFALGTLKKGYMELAQAYHTLSGMLMTDRHESSDFRNCTEQTCVLNYKLIKQLNLE